MPHILAREDLPPLGHQSYHNSQLREIERQEKQKQKQFQKLFNQEVTRIESIRGKIRS